MAEHPPDEWIEAANCLATVAQQLSSVVHEANNMLQVIAGSAEMIQINPGATDAVLKRSTLIAEQAHTVSALLGSVRELARFGPRRDGDRTDLSAALSTALGMRRHALNRARIAVTVEGGATPCLARCSWRPFMQIVLNVLLNAEQAVNGRSGAAIAIRLSRHDERVECAVTDNGGGMPASTPLPFTLTAVPEDAPRIGLGLEASRWLAEREGGCLTLEAVPGGTRAVLTLRA